MRTLAVITARGGSKRIPRKNIKDFLGRPIIAYSIRAAIDSSVFDTVMVSTEDEEIAQVAKDAGAEVPFLRSKDTADDHSTTADVLLEVLAEYEARGAHYDALCCIYPTAPFVTAEALQTAIRVCLVLTDSFGLPSALKALNLKSKCLFPNRHPKADEIYAVFLTKLEFG